MKERRNTKRDQIIEAAIKLWRETHNVKKVSLADIAREANVSQTTVYNNFDTREKLIDEVINYMVRDTLNKQWMVVRSDLPIPVKIQSIISVKTSAMQSVYTDVLAKLAGDTTTRRYLEDMYYTETKPMMDEIIEAGKKQGYIRPDLPNEAVMIYLDMLKDGGLANTERLKQLIDNKELMTGLTHIIYNGMFQKEFDFTIDFTSEKERE